MSIEKQCEILRDEINRITQELEQFDREHGPYILDGDNSADDVRNYPKPPFTEEMRLILKKKWYDQDKDIDNIERYYHGRRDSRDNKWHLECCMAAYLGTNYRRTYAEEQNWAGAWKSLTGVLDEERRAQNTSAPDFGAGIRKWVIKLFR